MKPFTAKHMFGAGSSPLKQTQSKRDSKANEDYKKEYGAAKDRRVAQNQVKINTENAKGYSKKTIDLNKKLVAKGTGSHGGASVNYRTGEDKIADFGNKYAKGGTYDRVLDAKTGKMVAKASSSNSSNDVKRASKDYLNPKYKDYNNESLRRAFIKDSINDREDKEIRLQGLRNRKVIAETYGGMQESEIGGGTKTPAKTPTKKPVKKLVKKSPLLQTKPTKKTLGSTAGTRDSIRREMIKTVPTKKQESLPPGTKTDGDMSKLDKYGRTPQEQKIHQERLSKMTPADHARIKAAGKATMEQIGEKRRTVAKMKKC
jgi:hypothetical protein